MRWLPAALVIVLAFEARADVWTYTDRHGIIHFTNIRPKKGSLWKRLAKTGWRKSASASCRRCASDRSPERFSRYDAHIREASLLYKIPVALIRAVIRAESDFDPRVISSVGARGLMQLMPATGREMGVERPFDPRENILGGTRYLRVLANRFTGNLRHTIAGYHAGPGAVDKYDGVPPYATTQSYVPKVIGTYNRYKIQFP